MTMTELTAKALNEFMTYIKKYAPYFADKHLDIARNIDRPGKIIIGSSYEYYTDAISSKHANIRMIYDIEKGEVTVFQIVIVEERYYEGSRKADYTFVGDDK